MSLCIIEKSVFLWVLGTETVRKRKKGVFQHIGFSDVFSSEKNYFGVSRVPLRVFLALHDDRKLSKLGEGCAENKQFQNSSKLVCQTSNFYLKTKCEKGRLKLFLDLQRVKSFKTQFSIFQISYENFQHFAFLT